MEHKIISQKKNPFMNREEIMLEINASSNPSFEQVREIIGKDKDLTVVKKVKGNFGSSVFSAEVFVYDSKEVKDRIEKVPRKIREKMAGKTTEVAPTPAAKK